MPITQVLSDARSREKPCIRCGYSLRGHLDARHCPECGLSVWLSLNQNEDMDWSNPVWSSALSLASWLLAAAQILGMFAWILLVIPADAFTGHLIAGRILVGIYFLACHSTMLILLCRHENRYPDRLKSQRTAMQIVSIIAILIGVLLIVKAVPLLQFGAMPPSPRSPILPRGQATPTLGMDFWLFLAELTFAASILATWTFYRRIARRIPNPAAGRLAAWLLLMPLIPFGKAVPFLTLYLAYQFSSLFALAPIIYFPATSVFLAWFALVLNRCSHRATENWTHETRPA